MATVPATELLFGAGEAEIEDFYMDPPTEAAIAFSGVMTTSLHLSKAAGFDARFRAYVYDYDPITGISTTLGIGVFDALSATVLDIATPTPISVDLTGKTLTAGHRLRWRFTAQNISNLPASAITLEYDSTIRPSRSNYCGALPASLTTDTAAAVLGLPVLEASKRDSLFTDADSDGIASPGDTLLYTVTLQNTGNSAASGVIFNDSPDSNTALVIGSVQTSVGTVTTGNGAGHTTVAANIGTIPGGGQVSITFRVRIRNPLPAGVTQISNQGTVNSNELPAVPTDDPDTGTVGDQTATPVSATAAPQITKQSSLVQDADGNGVVSPGDTLRYNLRLVNTGTATTANVLFSDTPDANTTLVVGSVLTDRGTVTTGNSAGNTTVAIAVGNVEPGDVVLISFDVTVNIGLVAGTVLSNQGQITYDSNGDGTNDSTQPTDGDTTQPGNQPTTNPIGGSPEGVAIKSVSDVNGGNLEPGDTLEYTIVLRNTSGFDAPGLVFEDPIPAHTVYLAGSVSSPAASTVVSTTPTLRITGINVPARSQVIVTFRVQVNNPLPAGVTLISNQGRVFFDSNGDGINDSSQTTDGNTVAPGNQPTLIPITAGPNFSQTTKTVALSTDADGNGVVSPGDTVRYTVRIPNTGNQDSLGAVFLLDTIPANTTYVGGSATADRGTASFNTGSNRVEWNGDVPAGTLVTVTFDVTINTGIQSGTVISNQGALRYDTDGDGTPDTTELTDSDTSAPGDQPTTLAVGGSPEGVARKTATDVNGGTLQPGDVLSYTVVLQNTSGFNIVGMEFIDSIPSHTNYITNSLTVPAGATIVTQSPTIRVSGLNVNAFSQVTLTFQVRITTPLAAGVTEIVNQGTVFYDSNGDGTNDASQTTDGNPSQRGQSAHHLARGYNSRILGHQAGQPLYRCGRQRQPQPRRYPPVHGGCLQYRQSGGDECGLCRHTGGEHSPRRRLCPSQRRNDHGGQHSGQYKRRCQYRHAAPLIHHLFPGNDQRSPVRGCNTSGQSGDTLQQ